VNTNRKSKGMLDWKAVIGILISIAALWWAFHDIHFAEVVAEVRLADPLWFTAAVFFATAVFAVRAWRWKTLLDPIQPGTGFRSRFAATTIGFMGNNLLPARIGEFARAFALSRMERVSVVGSFGSLVVERLFDAILIFSLLFISAALPGFPTGWMDDPTLALIVRSAVTLVAVLIPLAFLLVFAPVRAVRIFELLVRVLPARVRRPIVDALQAFLSGLGALRSPRLLVIATFQSTVLWLFNALGFWAAFKAFDIPIGFGGALFLQSVVALFVSVPSGPGFFGLFEGAARVVLTGLFGIVEQKSVAYAISFHLGGFIPVTLIGLYYAWRLGLSLADVERSEERVETAVETAPPPPADGGEDDV